MRVLFSFYARSCNRLFNYPFIYAKVRKFSGNVLEALLKALLQTLLSRLTL